MKEDKKGKDEMELGMSTNPNTGMDYMPQMQDMQQMPYMPQMQDMQQMPYMPYMPQTQQMPYMAQMPQMPVMCCPYLMNMQCPMMNNQNYVSPAMGQMMPGNQYMAPMMTNNQFMPY